MKNITQLFDHGKQVSVYYYIFFRSQNKSTNLFSRIAFFQGVLQRTPVQQEKSKSNNCEKLCLPYTASWKWLMHICSELCGIQHFPEFICLWGPFSPLTHINIPKTGCSAEHTLRKILSKKGYNEMVQQLRFWSQLDSNTSITTC